MSLIRVFLLVFAVILTAEPVVHNHPLLSSDSAGASICAICASAVGPLPLAAPALAAPEIVVTTFTATVLVEPAIVAAAPRASRAPPTA
jgi:hypothetical protein